MKTITQTINGRVSFHIPGGYFRLLSTVNALDVQLFRQNQLVADISQVEAGFAVRRAFDRIEIITGASEAVKFFYGADEASYDRYSGTVTVSGTVVTDEVRASTVGPETNHVTHATPATVSLITGAVSTRKKLVFRARSTNTAAVVIGGAAVTVNGPVSLAPGAVWEEIEAATAAWYSISSAASQKVDVMEANS